MTVMIWLREIKAVGIMDWLWFVVWLRRSEFSHKLSIYRYLRNGDFGAAIVNVSRARRRAHRIDIELKDLRIMI